MSADFRIEFKGYIRYGDDAVFSFELYPFKNYEELGMGVEITVDATISDSLDCLSQLAWSELAYQLEEWRKLAESQAQKGS